MDLVNGSPCARARSAINKQIPDKRVYTFFIKGTGLTSITNMATQKYCQHGFLNNNNFVFDCQPDNKKAAQYRPKNPV
jgi:hypothetical protein